MTNIKITFRNTLALVLCVSLLGGGCEYAVEAPNTDSEVEQAIEEAFDDGLRQGLAEGRTIGEATGEAAGYIRGLGAANEEAFIQGHTVGRAEGRTYGFIEGEAHGWLQGHAQGLLDAPATTYGVGYTAGYQDGQELGCGFAQYTSAYVCIFDVYTPDGVPGSPEPIVEGMNFLAALDSTLDAAGQPYRGDVLYSFASQIRATLGYADASAASVGNTVGFQDRIRATVNGELREFEVGVYSSDLTHPNLGYADTGVHCMRAK